MKRKLKQVVAAIGAVLALGLGITSIAAAAPEFTSSSYPLVYKGSGSAAYGSVVTEAGSMECSTGSASATLSQASGTLTIVEGAVSGCKAFGFSSATVSSNGCSALAHVKERLTSNTYSATVDLLCPEGKAVTSVAGTCETKVFPQTGNVTVELTNKEKGAVQVDFISASVKYTVTKDGIGCGFNGTGEKTGTFSQIQPAVISVEGKAVSVSGE